MSLITILVVDDAAHWRKFMHFIIRIDPALEIVAEAADGIDAVTKAEEFQPAIVLLDIGLPGISGIAAGRRILDRAPQSKIIFVSQEFDIEIVQEVLGMGATGYVLKNDAGSELLMAIHCAVCGQKFMSSSLPPTAGTKH